MAAPGLGYITNHVGLGVIVNGTTRLATSYTNGGLGVKPRLIVLGNGTMVHYDGTTDALTTPGIVTQEIFDTSAVAAYDTFYAALGNVGDLTLTNLGTGTSTAEAIFTNIEDTTPVQGNRDRMWYKLTWQIIGDWA